MNTVKAVRKSALKPATLKALHAVVTRRRPAEPTGGLGAYEVRSLLETMSCAAERIERVASVSDSLRPDYLRPEAGALAAGRLNGIAQGLGDLLAIYAKDLRSMVDLFRRKYPAELKAADL